jgi:hypothetical protein
MKPRKQIAVLPAREQPFSSAPEAAVPMKQVRTMAR